MANSTQLPIGLFEHEYWNTTNEKSMYPSMIVPVETSSKSTRILSLAGFIISNILAAIPILELYIGSRYADQCPVDYHIPHYLVVAGIVGIIIAVINIIQVVLERRILSSGDEQTPELVSAAGLCCVSCLSCILNLFLFFWFITGCYWIFRAKAIVQYDDKHHKNYCHPFLYRFAYWILLFALIFELLKCCQCCWKAPRRIKSLKYARTILTTTEP